MFEKDSKGYIIGDYPVGTKTFAEDFISKFSKDFAESSKEIFQRDLQNTLLSV